MAYPRGMPEPDPVDSDAPGEAAEAAHPPSASPEPAPEPARVLLVRHAVTHQTGPILSGRTPGIDLSDEGRVQAANVAGRLKDLPIAAIYASPIERTVQTAEVIAAHHGLDVAHLDGVIEAEYGGWTGQQIKDLVGTDLWKQVQRTPSMARFPDGESIREMQARAVAAIEQIAALHAGDLVVVVSHADVIKAVVAHFAGTHLDQFQRLVISPASVTGLIIGSQGAAVVKCNDTGSFDELLPRAADAPALDPLAVDPSQAGP
jgi:probable phosphomutase (TIGR03848 family)